MEWERGTRRAVTPSLATRMRPRHSAADSAEMAVWIIDGPTPSSTRLNKPFTQVWSDSFLVHLRAKEILVVYKLL